MIFFLFFLESAVGGDVWRRRHTVSAKAHHDADASCMPEVAAAVTSNVPNKVCTVSGNDWQNTALCTSVSTRAIGAGDYCERWLAGPTIGLLCWYG